MCHCFGLFPVLTSLHRKQNDGDKNVVFCCVFYSFSVLQILQFFTPFINSKYTHFYLFKIDIRKVNEWTLVLCHCPDPHKL